MMQMTINGVVQEFEVDDQTLLVEVLRDHFHLTGTHIGCDTSQCGCCTVLMNNEAIKSCTMLAAQATGSQIVTIEGLASDGLHPVQEAFSQEHGLQCGYCTPGMIMSTVHLLNRHPNPSDDQIKEGLAGNICRCTGYQGIVEAIMDASSQAKAS